MATGERQRQGGQLLPVAQVRALRCDTRSPNAGEPRPPV